MTRNRILALTAILFAGAAAAHGVRAATLVRAPQTVANVGYALSPTGTVSSLLFTLEPPSGRVRVRVSASRPWRSCVVAGPRVSCALDVPLAALQRLRVDAHG